MEQWTKMPRAAETQAVLCSEPLENAPGPSPETVQASWISGPMMGGTDLKISRCLMGLSPNVLLNSTLLPSLPINLLSKGSLGHALVFLL